MTRLHCSLRFTPNLTGYTRGSPCSKKPLETACKCLLKIYADQYELILPPKVVFCVFMVHFFLFVTEIDVDADLLEVSPLFLKSKCFHAQFPLSQNENFRCGGRLRL